MRTSDVVALLDGDIASFNNRIGVTSERATDVTVSAASRAVYWHMPGIGRQLWCNQEHIRVVLSVVERSTLIVRCLDSSVRGALSLACPGLLQLLQRDACAAWVL